MPYAVPEFVAFFIIVALAALEVSNGNVNTYSSTSIFCFWNFCCFNIWVLICVAKLPNPDWQISSRSFPCIVILQGKFCDPSVNASSLNALQENL